MEEKEIQVDEGISLSNVIRLLWSHVKLLILSLLVGCVLGSGFAVWKTYNVNYYGSSIEFYVNPEKDNAAESGESQYGVYGAYGRHVMDNMVKLLSSESFIEQMLLNGERLPAEKDDFGNAWWTATENEKYGITEKIALAQTEVDKLAVAQKALDDALLIENEVSLSIPKLNTAYTEAKNLVQEKWSEAYTREHDVFVSSLFSEDKYILLAGAGKLDEYALLQEAYNDMKAKESAWTTAKNSLTVYSDDVEDKTEAKLAAQKLANEKINVALEAWRKTKNYKLILTTYQKALHFSYLQADEEFDDADNLARSFIYVNVSVLNDVRFAETLLERIKEYVPVYVKDNMTVPTGYKSTNCLRTTRTDDIYLTNPNFTLKQAIKYGVLAGGAALVLVAIVIVLLDRSDKRLKDTEVITKYFNVPLLGIIPTIEDLTIGDGSKKAEPTTPSKEVK